MQIKPSLHTNRHKVNRSNVAIVVVIMLLFTLSFSSALGYLRDQGARRDLGELATLVASSINPTQIQILTASSKNLTNPQYHAVKAQLQQIRLSSPSIRFLYIMGQRE